MVDESILKVFLESNDIDEICELFDETYFNRNAIILLFDTVINPNITMFKNKDINQYCITGISNYERTFVLDSRYKSKYDREIPLGKCINLDLNILSKLKAIKNGILKNNIDDFIEYLKYIKKNEFNLNMSTAMVERVSVPMSDDFKANVWVDYVLSYVTYESIRKFNEYEFSNFRLTEDKYKWALEIYESSLSFSSPSNEYIVCTCLIMKAFILRNQSINKYDKIIQLLEYCLNELYIYLELELYLLALYLLEDDKVKRAFKKIETVSKGTLKKIKNTAWDILHIRMIETLMVSDLEKDKIIFEYMGTEDKGLQEIININPIKLMGIISGERIIKRKENLFDILPQDKWSAIDNMLSEHKRKSKGERSFETQYHLLKNQILNIEHNYFNKT